MTERRVRRREVRREGTDALLFDWTPKAGDGFVAWLDAAARLDLYEVAPTVCTTHRRFAPCRRCGPDNRDSWSSDPADVERVRLWHRSECGCAESPEFGTRGHVCIAEWMKP